MFSGLWVDRNDGVRIFDHTPLRDDVLVPIAHKKTCASQLSGGNTRPRCPFPSRTAQQWAPTQLAEDSGMGNV